MMALNNLHICFSEGAIDSKFSETVKLAIPSQTRKMKESSIYTCETRDWKYISQWLFYVWDNDTSILL